MTPDIKLRPVPNKLEAKVRAVCEVDGGVDLLCSARFGLRRIAISLKPENLAVASGTKGRGPRVGDRLEVYSYLRSKKDKGDEDGKSEIIPGERWLMFSNYREGDDFGNIKIDHLNVDAIKIQSTVALALRRFRPLSK